MTNILVLTDTHSGAHSSIIPPWSEYSRHNCNSPLGSLQRELWRAVLAIPEEHKHPDVVFFLGDGIEGKCSRNGGRELYTSDRNEQAKMCLQTLAVFRIPPKRFFAVRGTPYHTGQEEDFEDDIASYFKGEIDNSMFVKIEGVTFHLKHKSGSSSYEHLRPSAIAREKYYMTMHEEISKYPKANVFLRGHIHYNIGAYGPGWEAASIPAFSATGFNNYGTRQCNGEVHFGYSLIEVNGDSWDMRHFVTPLQTTVPKVFNLTESGNVTQ